MARAEPFYEKVFGWQVMRNMEGIPVFSVDGTPQGMVADLQKAENFPPHWITYVVVDQIEPATERASKPCSSTTKGTAGAAAWAAVARSHRTA